MNQNQAEPASVLMTPKAHRAFEAYAAMAQPRSLRRLAAQCDWNVKVLFRWSSKYAWKKRLVAAKEKHEALVESAKAKALERSADRWADEIMTERTADLETGRALREKATELLAKLGEKPASLGEVARALSVASALSRRACGEPLDESGGGQKASGPQVAVQIVLPSNGTEEGHHDEKPAIEVG